MGAIDYVVEPIDAEWFQKTLERVRRRVFSGEDKMLENKLADLLSNLKPAAKNCLERIAFKEKERVRFISIEKIEWISSQGNYVEIHAEGEKFLLRETMDGIESKLNPKEFVRIRHLAIIRIPHIKELRALFNSEFEVVLNGGVKIASSRRYRKNLDALLKS